MRLRCVCGFLVALAVAPAAFADGTIRYTSSVKFGPIVAALAATQAAHGNGSINVTPPQAPSVTMHLKGDTMEQDGGAFTGIYDSKTGQITLIDPKRKIFATSSLKDLVDQLVASLPAQRPLPPQAQVFLKSITTTFASQKTGRTGMTLGLETEETEMTFSVNITLPPGLLPPMPNTPFQPGAPITLLKIVFDIWNPTAAEMARVPALGEIASYWSDQSSMNGDFAGVVTEVQKALAKYPGLGAALPAMMADSFKNKRGTLKCDVEVYAPVLAQIAPMMKAHGVADFDPNAAVVDFTVEATEVSSEPIDDAVFKVPGDYHATPFADFLRPGSATKTGRLGGFSAHAGGGSMQMDRGMSSEPADEYEFGRRPF
ncbi:MAG: hypothetical protein WBF06_14605 [Candidatus Acidiferrales bacterium]